MRYAGIRLGVVQRSKGKTTTYRSRYQLCEIRPRKGDDKKKEVHVLSRMEISSGPLGRNPDPLTVWQSLERYEVRRNAAPARTVDMPIPREFSLDATKSLIKRLAYAFAGKDFPVQIDVHNQLASDGGMNPHLHIMFATRQYGPSGWFPKKDRRLQAMMHKHRGAYVKERIVYIINDVASEFGYLPKVHLRSNRELGLPVPELRRPPGVSRRPNPPANAAWLARDERLRFWRSSIAKTGMDPVSYERLRLENELAEIEKALSIAEIGKRNPLAMGLVDLILDDDDRSPSPAVSVEGIDQTKPLDLAAEGSEFAVSHNDVCDDGFEEPVLGAGDPTFFEVDDETVEADESNVSPSSGETGTTGPKPS